GRRRGRELQRGEPVGGRSSQVHRRVSPGLLLGPGFRRRGGKRPEQGDPHRAGDGHFELGSSCHGTWNGELCCRVLRVCV
ncbi:hypothetical protein THAOC_01570, partial [Thalassiosira oceanica]